jgi:hypothetical protein
MSQFFLSPPFKLLIEDNPQNDIHPTAIARDLVVLYALKELSTIRDIKGNFTRWQDLMAMVHYVYWAAVMPPRAGQILDEFVERVFIALTEAKKKNEPVSEGWIFIEPTTCAAVLESLTWWRAYGKTAMSFKDMLPSA